MRTKTLEVEFALPARGTIDKRCRRGKHAWSWSSMDFGTDITRYCQRECGIARQTKSWGKDQHYVTDAHAACNHGIHGRAIPACMNCACERSRHQPLNGVIIKTRHGHFRQFVDGRHDEFFPKAPGATQTVGG